MTGLLDVSLGLNANAALGAEAPPELITDPVIDSQYRYLGAIWFGFGVMLCMVAGQLPESSRLLRVMLCAVFLGGLGRLMTVARFGLPETSVGAIFIPTTIAIETAGMLLLLWWHVRLVRS